MVHIESMRKGRRAELIDVICQSTQVDDGSSFTHPTQKVNPWFDLRKTPLTLKLVRERIRIRRN